MLLTTLLLCAPGAFQSANAKSIPSKDVRFAQSVVALGDVNGDGTPEIAIGDPAEYGETMSTIWVVSGLEAKPLYRVEAESREFGASLAGGADLNGNGCLDFVASLRSESGGTVVRAFDGKDGARLWNSTDAAVPNHTPSTVNYPGLKSRHVEGLTNLTMVGPAMAIVPDVNEGGASDVLITCAGPRQGSVSFVTCIAGESGEVLWKQTLDVPLGYVLERAGDLDGDGIEDVLLGAPAWKHEDLEPGVGQVLAMSSADGRVLWSATGKEKERFFGNGVTTFDDQDGDGVRDVLVGSGFEWERSNCVDVLSGASGESIRRLKIALDLGEHWKYRESPKFDGFGAKLVTSNGVIYSTRISGWAEIYLFRSDGKSDFRSAGAVGASAEGTQLFNLGDLDGDGLDELATTGARMSGYWNSFLVFLEIDEDGQCEGACPSVDKPKLKARFGRK